MNRQQMIDRLNALTVGQQIILDGTLYTVRGIKHQGGKLNRVDVALLEDGVPASVEKVVKFGPSTGKTYTESNITHKTWYAQKSCMTWQTV